jgi:hypothetical protein
LTGPWLEDAIQVHQQRRFASTVRAHDGHTLTLPNRQVRAT